MMTINAKNDVLNDQELDVVSGGMLWIPASVVPTVQAIFTSLQQHAGPESSPTKDGGGQNDPAQMFQQSS
jgi:hypothetical protein